MNRFWLLCFLSIVSVDCKAKEYALVIGGLSNNVSGSTQNEFARKALLTSRSYQARGVDVSVLYSGKDMAFQERDFYERNKIPGIKFEQEHYKEEFQYLNKHFPDAKAATKANLIDQLKKFSERLKSGDKLKLDIFAHGSISCNQASKSGGIIESRRNELNTDMTNSCHHRFALVGSNGYVEYVSSDIILNLVKELDAKGVEVDLNMESCQSGVIKERVKDLKHACVQIASSSNGLAYTCFEHDPPGATDYTSVAEVSFFYKIRHILPEVLQDPFFKNNNCLKKVQDHVQQKVKPGENESTLTLFNKAYKFDSTMAQPSISSLLNLEYFQKNFYNEQLDQLREYICSDHLVSHLDHLSSVFKLADNIEYNVLKQNLTRAIEQYNISIEAQKKLIIGFEKKSEVDKEKILQRISEIQKNESKKHAQEIITNERSLMDLFLKNNKNESGSCNRSIV